MINPLTVEVPKLYLDLALGFDVLLLTGAILFRKPKAKQHAASSTDWAERHPKAFGLSLIAGAFAIVLFSHFGVYVSELQLASYYIGLVLAGVLFITGLRVVLNG